MTEQVTKVLRFTILRIDLCFFSFDCIIDYLWAVQTAEYIATLRTVGKDSSLIDKRAFSSSRYHWLAKLAVAAHANLVRAFADHHGAVKQQQTQSVVNNRSVPPSLGLAGQISARLHSAQAAWGEICSRMHLRSSLFPWIGYQRWNFFSGLSGHVQTVFSWYLADYPIFVLFLLEPHRFYSLVYMEFYGRR